MDLFADVARDLDDRRLGRQDVADISEVLADLPGGALLRLAATDAHGQFWPWRAASHILEQSSHRDRALAFRATPPQYKNMVGALIHRAIFERSRA